MGSSVLEPSGHWLNAYLSGIHERTYLNPPTHFVALAVWFRVVGFSAFTMRMYSVMWGVVGLLALFFLIRRLLNDDNIAHLAVCLTAIDFIYLWTTADGRMDATAAALGMLSIAAYLRFRELNLKRAVLISQALGAAAVFTHPNALVLEFSLVVLAISIDWHRLRPSHLAISAVPYCTATALWGIYILQNLSDFRSQFMANAAGYDSARLTGLRHPIDAIGREIFRYLYAYCVSSVWSATMRPWFVTTLLIYLAALLWLVWRWRRVPRPFLVLLGAVLVGQTFLDGLKGHSYLIYAAPFLNTVLAIFLASLWRRRGDAGGVAVVSCAAFLVLQLSISLIHIKTDEYHRDFLPLARMLRSFRNQGKQIDATAAVGFGLDFAGFADDIRLGAYSHKEAPDVIVLDRMYRAYLTRSAKREPFVTARSLALLESRYRLTERFGSYWVFSRTDIHDSAPAQGRDAACFAANPTKSRGWCYIERLSKGAAE